MAITQGKATSLIISSKSQWPVPCTDGDGDSTKAQLHRFHSSSPIHPTPAEPLTCMSGIDHSPLPHDWEQFLNPKTGEVYYIHWSTCRKAFHDPRQLQRLADEQIRSTFRDLYSFIDSMDNTLSYNLKLEDFSHTSNEDYTASSDDTDERLHKWDSLSSSGIITKVQKVDDALDLVVMGCRSCLVYILCPIGTLKCSNCGTSLLHLKNVTKEGT